MRIVIGKKDEASLLLEGRRENAQAIIAKKIESPELIEYIQISFIVLNCIKTFATFFELVKK